MNSTIGRRNLRWALMALACAGSAIAAFSPAREVAGVQATSVGVVESTSSVNPLPTLPARQWIGRLRAEAGAPPAAPPVPYRFAGTVRQAGVLRVVLAAGDSIHMVQPGEVLEGAYYVRTM